MTNDRPMTSPPWKSGAAGHAIRTVGAWRRRSSTWKTTDRDDDDAADLSASVAAAGDAAAAASRSLEAAAVAAAGSENLEGLGTPVRVLGGRRSLGPNAEVRGSPSYPLRLREPWL